MATIFFDPKCVTGPSSTFRVQALLDTVYHLDVSTKIGIVTTITAAGREQTWLSSMQQNPMWL